MTVRRRILYARAEMTNHLQAEDETVTFEGGLRLNRVGGTVFGALCVLSNDQASFKSLSRREASCRDSASISAIERLQNNGKSTS